MKRRNFVVFNVCIAQNVFDRIENICVAISIKYVWGFKLKYFLFSSNSWHSMIQFHIKHGFAYIIIDISHISWEFIFERIFSIYFFGFGFDECKNVQIQQ